MPFAATWMGLETVILSEVSQRRRNILWHPLYVESKKKWYKWIYLQNIKRFTDLENELMVAGGRMGKAIVKRFGMGMYTLLYLKQITNKDLVYSMWNSVQWYVATRTERESGENGCMCTYGSIPLLFTLNRHNIVNWLYGNTKWEAEKKRHPGDWHALPPFAPPEFSQLVFQAARGPHRDLLPWDSSGKQLSSVQADGFGQRFPSTHFLIKFILQIMDFGVVSTLGLNE